MFARTASLLLAALPALALAQAQATPAPAPTVLPSQCDVGGAVRVLAEAAAVRVAPSDTAGVKAQLQPGASFCVLPGESRGYLRVVLADGRSGYLRASSLAAEGTLPAAPVEVAASKADLAPRLKVRDLDQLAVLVKDDPVAAGEASKLLRSRKAATWTVVGAGAVTVTGLVVGFVDPWRCSQSGTCTSTEARSTTATAVMISSLVIGVVGGVVGMVMYPTNSDLNAVIAGYNGRHGPPGLEPMGRAPPSSPAAGAVPVH